MRAATLLLLVLGLNAAVWKPVAVETLKAPEYWGLEENKGQAASGVLLQARGSGQAMAIDARGVLFSPSGVRFDFVGGNLGASVALTELLPGVVNVYSGADDSKWVKGARRFARGRFVGIYPGVNISYVSAPDTGLTMQVELAAGVDPSVPRWVIRGANRLELAEDGQLRAVVREGKPGYRMQYPIVGVSQGKVARWTILGSECGIAVEGRDPAAPLVISIGMGNAGLSYAQPTRFASGAEGDAFALRAVADAAGKDAPFPQLGWTGCGSTVGQPIACADVSIARYSKTGELRWISFLEGESNESSTFLGVGRDGSLIVVGATDSAKFPVNPAALQRSYAGPAARIVSSSAEVPGGDLFLARIDAKDGSLLASTYWGGPEADGFGQAQLGGDGSIFLFPKFLGPPVGNGMPVSAGAFQPRCGTNPCTSGYAARFEATLERSIYATYLPGNTYVARLGGDGSLYFAGKSEEAFPVTTAAYQQTAAGGSDGFVARLNPNGGRLLFGTYLGTPKQDAIYRMAVALDGSVWADVESSGPSGTEYSLVHLDAAGEKVLGRQPIGVEDLFADELGRLHALTQSEIVPSPDALSRGSCGLRYVVLNAKAESIYATQLPVVNSGGFAGVSPSGRPTFGVGATAQFEIEETLAGDVFGACVVDAARFGNPDQTSPGAIVTIWGSKLGPAQGVAFLLKDGSLPRQLGGTRVLVGGEAVPLLYVSEGQINAILPFDLTPGAIQVEREGKLGNAWNLTVLPMRITLFPVALNFDGSSNSQKNPAKKGSIVVFFGTGGGVTRPASVAGEVSPLALIPLEQALTFHFGDTTVGPYLAPLYAGAAPGLVAGINQFHVRVPELIGNSYSTLKGLVSVLIIGQGGAAGPTLSSIWVEE